MKFQLIKFFFNHVAAFLSALAILAFLTNAPFFSYSDLPYPYQNFSSSSPIVSVLKDCDIFRGEWIPDVDAPYYTNSTCFAIQEHQNCMKYGRPDQGFLKWQWKPAGCELPRFDPSQFLQLVRHKSLAFVGDSLARNHMQSLMCLLSKVEYPKDISKTKTTDQNRNLHYQAYNFTISIFWSPFLVRAKEADQDGLNHTGVWNLYLDEPDDNWMSGIANFDYVVISAANWFTRPSIFYEKGRPVGCSYCMVHNVPDLTFHYSHRMAYRTVLRAITNLDVMFKGKIILRTLSTMSHFENGEWNKGGDCKRTRPYQSNETSLGGLDLDLYTAQVEEFREAEKVAREKGVQLKLMDTTGAMLLRPDGHPSRYGHWPHDKVTLYNDCVHWCLPGPIDVWNDMLFHMLLL